MSNEAPARSAAGNRPPIATIYQNSDQVAGIVQQLFGQPLITGETRDSSRTEDTSVDGGAASKVDGKVSVKVPAFFGAQGNLSGEARVDASWSQTTGTVSRQQFVYSQAYYLHLVREQLIDGAMLTTIRSIEEAKRLRPGDFVEYTTTFDPVELTLMLDVISPELVSQIAKHVVERQYMKSFPETGGRDAVVAHAEKMRVDAHSRGELAAAIARAFQADTRQTTTREYYGRISSHPALTAITICDAVHFIVSDPDRLLDGTFTVLGKVISVVEDDVPTLARNKVLRNVSAYAFDRGIDAMEAMLDATPAKGGISASNLLDVKIKSRVEGASFRVLPLAIFT